MNIITMTVATFAHGETQTKPEQVVKKPTYTVDVNMLILV